MKNEEKKKEAVTTELDELTDEQLETILGGLVIGGQTNQTVFAASVLTMDALSQTAYCGSSAASAVTFPFVPLSGSDGSSGNVFTKD